MNLLVVEMRRSLRRRVVRVLVLIALLGCVFAGVIAFTSSSGKEVVELTGEGQSSPAVLTNWWGPDTEDPALLIASLFLMMGGFFAGAAVAGAEWRAGTITTVLTWEPRRVRLHVARTAACGILAFVIGLALEVVFLAAFLPAVFANGATTGTDADWWLSLGLAMARTALLTSCAAMMGVALATLGRNTAFALGVVFAWVAVLENLVHSLQPALAPYLWIQNVGAAAEWKDAIVDGEVAQGPVRSLVTVALYAFVLVTAATISFQRRDIPGTS